MRWFDGIIHSMDMSLSKLRERVKDREAWWAECTGLQKVGHDLVLEQQHCQKEAKGSGGRNGGKETGWEG